MTGKSKSFGEVFDAHTAAEFQTRDIEATMATMGETPHVTHVPVMTGGHGADAVRSFYETWFIGHWPEDAKITLVSRTVGESQLVDELILSFTHDCEMPAILPGIKPSAKWRSPSWSPSASRATRSPMSVSTGTRRQCWCSSGSWTRPRCR
jgi:carboxymethylenebutenolidase